MRSRYSPPLLAVFFAFAAPAFGQAQEARSQACWTQRNAPDCRSHWIVEVRGAVPLASTGDVQFLEADGSLGTSSAFEPRLEWEVGHLFPVSSAWSVGATAALGTGGHPGPVRGARVRARRWRDGRPLLEVEAGYVRSDGAGRRPDGASGARLGVRGFPVGPLGLGVHAEWLEPDTGGDARGPLGLGVDLSVSETPGLLASGAIGLIAVAVAISVGLGAT